MTTSSQGRIQLPLANDKMATSHDQMLKSQIEHHHMTWSVNAC